MGLGPGGVSCTFLKDDMQPHIGTSITAMASLPGADGFVAVGDEEGLVTMWGADGKVLFETNFAPPVRGFCSCENDKLWISAGTSLHLVDAKNLKVLHSFISSQSKGFTGMVLSGDQLWVADGCEIKIFSMAACSLLKLIHLPAMDDITCMAPVGIMGRLCIITGSRDGMISIFDVNTKSSIKSYTEFSSSVEQVLEVGENTVLVLFDNRKSVLLDFNKMSV
jgi:hypothetical protein